MPDDPEMRSTQADALLLRPGALGDAVLTLPLLLALRAACGGAVEVIGEPSSWAFRPARAAWWRLADIGSPDLLGLFGSDRPLPPALNARLRNTGVAVACLGDPRAVPAALEHAGVGRVLAVAPPRREASGGDHAALRLCRALAPLGIDAGAALAAAGAELPGLLRPDDAERRALAGRPGLAGLATGGYVLLHPGSGGRHKCWPVGRLAALVPLLPLPAVVLFGPAEADLVAPFRAALPAGADARIAGRLPLREVVALIADAAACIAADCGVGHLAARLAPTLSLFGPTDPDVWRPLGCATAVLRAPGGDLDRLAPATVADAVRRLLAESQAAVGRQPGPSGSNDL